MDDYDVTLNLSDGRVVVVTVRATSDRDAIAKARNQYASQDRTATYNFDIQPTVRRSGSATSGGSGQSGSTPLTSRPPIPETGQGAPAPVTTGTPTLGSGGLLGGLTREQNIDTLALGDNEEAAIRLAYRDLNPGSQNASSLSRGLLDQFIGTLTNAYEGASASGRLPANASISEFVRNQTPASARQATAENLLTLLEGGGVLDEIGFNTAEATDQLVSASGAFGSEFRRAVQGRLGEFNRDVESRQLDPGATDRSAYVGAFDQAFPNLRRLLEGVARP